MSKTTTAFTFAEANPVGDEPLAYDGSLTTLATEADELIPSADDINSARLFCRPGFRRCGRGFNPWCSHGNNANAISLCSGNHTAPGGCCSRGSRCLLGKWCIPRFFGHSAEGPAIAAAPPPPENRTDPIAAPEGAPPTAPENPTEST
ncbi:hypothetical protein BGX30_004300 [Mortierella sp. GBA39]|nr:hypothetical protein BGX30_004300 [Mortierella sp. GBA39]